MMTTNGTKRYPIFDSDVHHAHTSLRDITPYMSTAWREYIGYGADAEGRQPWSLPSDNRFGNSRSTQRLDTIPPNGGPPASDPAFLVEDHLNRYDIDYALLSPGSTLGLGRVQNLDLAADVARAVNDWTIDKWFPVDDRFLGSILVGPKDPLLAAKEIRRLADNPRMVQITLNALPSLLGNRSMRPIWEAAAETGLPVNLHVPVAIHHTPVGEAGSFIEYHIGMTIPGISQLMSVILEGTFELFPNVNFVMNEFGIAWLPFLMWRMDMEWRAGREDVPYLKKRPSDYIRSNVRFSTQPLELPDQPADLVTLLDLVDGKDLLIFATDYPHWDFDNPDFVLKEFPEDWRRKIFFDNAAEVYNLEERLGVTLHKQPAQVGASA